jgi:hypothetical protein
MVNLGTLVHRLADGKQRKGNNKELSAKAMLNI